MSFYCFFHSLGVMPVICLKMRKKELSLVKPESRYMLVYY